MIDYLKIRERKSKFKNQKAREFIRNRGRKIEINLESSESVIAYLYALSRAVVAVTVNINNNFS